MNLEIEKDIKLKVKEHLKFVKKERLYTSIYAGAILMFLVTLIYWAESVPILMYISILPVGILGFVLMFILNTMINLKKLNPFYYTEECVVKDKYYISTVDNTIEDERRSLVECDKYNVLLDNSDFSNFSSEEIFKNIEIGKKYLFVFSGKNKKENKLMRRNYIICCYDID